MSLDDVFMAVVVGGIALAGAYIRSEYRLWRMNGAAERRRAIIQGELHTARLSQQPGRRLEPPIAQLQSFSEADAASAEDIPVDRRDRQRHAAH